MTLQTQQANHLKVWDKASKTDPAFTKENSYASGGKTSINTTYMFKRATEIFGPVGIGWGYEIITDEIRDGASKVFGPANAQRTMTESIHTLRIKFWYKLDGERGEFEQFGHTDFVTLSSKGVVHTESEPQKKSLSDAIKKSLSMLGFSADIFTGLFDDQQYVNEVRKDLIADAAETQIDREAEKYIEFGEWVSEQMRMIDEIGSAHTLAVFTKKTVRVLAERLSHGRIAKAQHDKGVRAITQHSEKRAEELKTTTTEENTND
jgi:hypothetical protein